MNSDKYEQERDSNNKARQLGIGALLIGLAVGIVCLIFNNFEISIGTIGSTEFVFAYDLLFFILLGFIVAAVGFALIVLSARDGKKLSITEATEKKHDGAKLTSELELAEAGDAEAQFELGCRYDRGDGVERDFAAAYGWWLKSAKQGHATSQYNVGSMLENGDGVEKDYAEAFRWFSLSGEQGYPTAMYRLGYFYKEGRHVGRDDAIAFEWFEKAAEKGNAWACYNLGQAYLEGAGRPADRAKAIDFLTRAADQKIKAARTKLDELLGGKNA